MRQVVAAVGPLLPACHHKGHAADVGFPGALPRPQGFEFAFVVGKAHGIPRHSHRGTVHGRKLHASARPNGRGGAVGITDFGTFQAPRPVPLERERARRTKGRRGFGSVGDSAFGKRFKQVFGRAVEPRRVGVAAQHLFKQEVAGGDPQVFVRTGGRPAFALVQAGPVVGAHLVGGAKLVGRPASARSGQHPRAAHFARAVHAEQGAAVGPARHGAVNDAQVAVGVAQAVQDAGLGTGGGNRRNVGHPQGVAGHPGTHGVVARGFGGAGSHQHKGGCGQGGVREDAVSVHSSRLNWLGFQAKLRRCQGLGPCTSRAARWAGLG